jgi:hypothetical protein
MDNATCFTQQLAEIRVIPREDVRQPKMPMDVYLQEAENLHGWCHADRVPLEAAGLDWALVEALPVRIGAAREAESRWFNKRFAREEAARVWQAEAPAGFRQRDSILHAMRYAYRRRPDLLGRVSALAGGTKATDMIQDLNDAAVLGREHPEPLTAVGFDLSKLEHAANRSAELGELLAAATNDRACDRSTKLVRDQAFTFLKQAVDEIRACGQYVFWQDAERARGYASAHMRAQRRRASRNTVAPSPTTTNGPGVAETPSAS